MDQHSHTLAEYDMRACVCACAPLRQTKQYNYVEARQLFQTLFFSPLTHPAHNATQAQQNELLISFVSRFHNFILIISTVLLFTLNYLNLFKIQLVVACRRALTHTQPYIFGMQFNE